jgi:hypothetical protein
MTVARAQVVDAFLTRWYHCMTRYVCRAFLLGEGDHNCTEWLENRLEELIARPFLRVHPRQAAGHQRTPRCAPSGQPDGLSASMIRF